MRNDQNRLRDILLSLDDIQLFVEGMTKKQFLNVDADDRKTFRAVSNCISTLGEAIKNLTPDITSKYQNIDWAGLAGMKDIVTHQYFQVRLDLLWNTIVHELPALREIILAELSNE